MVRRSAVVIGVIASRSLAKLQWEPMPVQACDTVWQKMEGKNMLGQANFLLEGGIRPLMNTPQTLIVKPR